MLSGSHRHVVERDAVPFDEAAEGVVVGDDAGDLDVEFLRLPARQQVVEAMLLLRHQQHQTLLHRRVADAPVHLQGLADGNAETIAELGQQERQRRRLDLHAHEVAAGQVVGVDSSTRGSSRRAAMKPETLAMMPTWSGQEAVSV